MARKSDYNGLMRLDSISKSHSIGIGLLLHKCLENGVKVVLDYNEDFLLITVDKDIAEEILNAKTGYYLDYNLYKNVVNEIGSYTDKDNLLKRKPSDLYINIDSEEAVKKLAKKIKQDGGMNKRTQKTYQVLDEVSRVIFVSQKSSNKKLFKNNKLNKSELSRQIDSYNKEPLLSKLKELGNGSKLTYEVIYAHICKMNNLGYFKSHQKSL